MKSFLVLDCETTKGDVTPETEPIEISWRLLTEEEGKNVVFMMRPEVPCLPCATVIHGLAQAEIDKFDPIKEVLPKVYNAFKELSSDTVVIAYNAPFDIGVIDQAFQKYIGKRFQPKRVLDLLRLAQKLIDKAKSGNHRLSTVHYYLFPEKLHVLLSTRAIHSGLVDAELTEEVLLGLWDLASEKEGHDLAIDELIEFTQRAEIVEVWDWGRHKGKLVADVVDRHPDYIRWFFKQDWHTEEKHRDLVYTINQLKR